MGLTFKPVTPAEGVSGMSSIASANRVMVDDPALSVRAASARARVFTPLVNTGLVQRTFCANNTLRSAVRRNTNELSPARANGMTITFPAVTVRATG
jgi:hypothetical protein